MKKQFAQTIVALLCSTFVIKAQTVTPNLQDTAKWRLINRQVLNINEADKKGIQFKEEDGGDLMILKGFKFDTGTIEFDTKGKDAAGESFVGIAFHIQNDSTYDALYFRPFNFAPADTNRKYHAVQYVSLPKFDWDYLRENFPLKYESRVYPAPNPNEWFHVKLVVDGKIVSAFVNGNDKPCLVVEKLSGTKTGGLAIWINGIYGSFANLVIKP